MPNLAQHVAIGAVASAGTYFGMCIYLKHEANLGELLLCVGVGVLGAAAPDIFDPPTHPNHRAFGHSLTLGAGLAGFGGTKCLNAGASGGEFGKILFSAAVVSYLSHLIADSCTPRGLPLLGL